MWVFPKDLPTYQALEAEFKATADVFAIRQPQGHVTALKSPNTTILTNAPVASPMTEEEFEEQLTVGVQQEPDKGQDIDPLRELVLGLKESLGEQHRMVETVIQQNEALNQKLSAIDGAKREKSKEVHIIKELPDHLDLTKAADLSLLEKALIAVGFVTCGRDQNFMNWTIKHKPLLTPLDFVCKTHELLKEQLEKIAGFGGPETKFWQLVDHIRTEELIFSDRQDPVQVFHILGAMNALRNQFTHQRREIGEGERMTRSILYLMNMALVWRRVMVDENAREMEATKNQQINHDKA